jgi:hypothetical protein
MGIVVAEADTNPDYDCRGGCAIARVAGRAASRFDIIDALLGKLASLALHLYSSANVELAPSNSNGFRGCAPTSASFPKTLIHNGAIVCS